MQRRKREIVFGDTKFKENDVSQFVVASIGYKKSISILASFCSYDHVALRLLIPKRCISSVPRCWMADVSFLLSGRLLSLR
jgi:hypothetical protein